MDITELTVAVWSWRLTVRVFVGLVTDRPALSLALPRALGMPPWMSAAGVQAACLLARWPSIQRSPMFEPK